MLILLTCNYAKEYITNDMNTNKEIYLKKYQEFMNYQN